MGYAVLKSSVSFTLHIRCENCNRESKKVVEMPIGDDMPRDANELIESVFLESIPFRCRSCDSVIGRIIGIKGGNGYE